MKHSLIDDVTLAAAVALLLTMLVTITLATMGIPGLVLVALIIASVFYAAGK